MLNLILAALGGALAGFGASHIPHRLKLAEISKELTRAKTVAAMDLHGLVSKLESIVK